MFNMNNNMDFMNNNMNFMRMNQEGSGCCLGCAMHFNPGYFYKNSSMNMNMMDEGLRLMNQMNQMNMMNPMNQMNMMNPMNPMNQIQNNSQNSNKDSNEHNNSTHNQEIIVFFSKGDETKIPNMVQCTLKFQISFKNIGINL